MRLNGLRHTTNLQMQFAAAVINKEENDGNLSNLVFNSQNSIM